MIRFRERACAQTCGRPLQESCPHRPVPSTVSLLPVTNPYSKSSLQDHACWLPLAMCSHCTSACMMACRSKQNCLEVSQLLVLPGTAALNKADNRPVTGDRLLFAAETLLPPAALCICLIEFVVLGFCRTIAGWFSTGCCWHC